MTLYDKINKFIGKHSYLPEIMYGDNKSCTIKYDVSNLEMKGFYGKLERAIRARPELWNHSDISLQVGFEPTLNGLGIVEHKIIVTANSGGKI